MACRGFLKISHHAVHDLPAHNHSRQPHVFELPRRLARQTLHLSPSQLRSSAGFGAVIGPSSSPQEGHSYEPLEDTSSLTRELRSYLSQQVV
ncbi:hypothetical protein IE81DRAFT_117373 [Ceraceosorus guamensis]|uniref:Uncharacterized protein n=1 Tax=Ceraceosorus guamensis TaxID=1522189 RepID=A0A316VYY2_9BASI|nr:hypothetical protein IE81DRAFT_117373 [Ceraceosorus guamensis]PWN42652.1 hypothetical protein IE81DRAFT_117373 [Ceraceosorus guamensis]